MNIIKNHRLGLAAAIALLAIPGLSWADNRSGEIIITDLQSEKEFSDLMPVTGKVKTFFGDFDMEHSVPTEETTERIYELLNHQRAAQLYLWGLPIVAHEQLVQGYFENFEGYEYNTFVRVESFNERRGYLTANETTNYALGTYNTKDSAVILDVPPGVIIGMIDDMWQESPTDIGIFGPNSGRGGKHVIIGPSTPPHMQPDPSGIGDDFNIARVNTNRGVIVARVSGGTIEETLRTWDKMRMYNYGKEPSINVISGEDKMTQTIQPRGIAYWKLLHAAINNEVVAERDRHFMYWLRTLGIERGKPFNPDEKQKAALLDGAKVGEMMAKSFVFSERLDGVLREFDWRYVLGGEWGDGIKNNQSMRDYDIFDPRARYTYEAMTTSPSMTIPRAGGAQGYVAKFEDSDGNRFKGEERYVMIFDSQPPQTMFWSLTIYDPDTRALLNNRGLKDGSDVTVDSMAHKPKLNADGSYVVMLGPDEAPEGWASNYVRTLPGRGWFPYIRAYGAEKEFFDGTYQLPNIHRVENFDEYVK